MLMVSDLVYYLPIPCMYPGFAEFLGASPKEQFRIICAPLVKAECIAANSQFFFISFAQVRFCHLTASLSTSAVVETTLVQLAVRQQFRTCVCGVYVPE